MSTTLVMGLLFLACTFLYISACLSTSVRSPCPPEESCTQAEGQSTAICGLDEDENCIRKYPSKCLMDIAACHAGRTFTDYSSVYCAMESFLCEESSTYERWTLFFGYEKD